MIKLQSYSLTDTGRQRDHNEDFLLCDAENGLYVLCDGMGGHAAGEVAARIAAETLVDFYTEHHKSTAPKWPHPTFGLVGHHAQALCNAICEASQRVFTAALKERRLEGMGTTLCAVAATDDKLVVAHVGDSRVYRLRGGRLTVLTEDHSQINYIRRAQGLSLEEAKRLVPSNIIVRAVGLRESVEPEVQSIDVQQDDLLLLCSDGLSDLVDDWLISELLSNVDDRLEVGAHALVDQANAHGGRDNISVVLLRVLEVPDQGADAHRRPTLVPGKIPAVQPREPRLRVSEPDAITQPILRPTSPPPPPASAVRSSPRASLRETPMVHTLPVMPPFGAGEPCPDIDAHRDPELRRLFASATVPTQP